MKLSKNPIFLKHKVQIEEALSEVTGPVRASGEQAYKRMLISAEELDLIIEPKDGERPNPASVSIKRDAFHKSCRELGEWLSEHVPTLVLKWED